MLGKVVLPVLRDLISLDNEVLKLVKDRKDSKKFPPEKQDWANLLDQVAMFHDDITEILERYGIVAFQEEGERFNPRTQRVLGTVVTEEQDLHRTIAERIRPGFCWGEQLIRNEEVLVYKYDAPQDDIDPSNS
jgi:molecular chaperone GrpE (heat shock protein)